MPADIPSFRALYSELFHYAGRDVYLEVLLPWLSKAQEAMAVLGRYGSLEALQWRKDQPDPCDGGDGRYYSCLERLYALSRVSDILLLPSEPILPPAPVDPPQNDPWLLYATVTAEQRHAWWTALGMKPIDESLPFHPFYHEIVTVEQADDPQEQISLTGTLWTGFMLGQMMFCRAGVSVRGGRDHIVKEIAETSRIYWTYQRNNRRARDLSHGWGSNSQWGTDFRRDYVTEDAYNYNVDGPEELFDAEGRLVPGVAYQFSSAASAIELMRHRCFIRTPEEFYSKDLYDNTYREPRAN
jgi:hypothetical protein